MNRQFTGEPDPNGSKHTKVKFTGSREMEIKVTAHVVLYPSDWQESKRVITDLQITASLERSLALPVSIEKHIFPEGQAHWNESASM